MWGWLLLELAFVGFLVWQLISVRRAMREPEKPKEPSKESD